MIIQEPDTQNVHNRGHGQSRLLCTLCRGLRTFPHKTRSPPLDFSHYMVFEKRMTETQSFRSASTLRPGRPYHLHPLHLLVYHCKSSHDLINYARAHNSLWLHTEVSSMNNLMIPLSLGGEPQDDHTGTPGYPRTTLDYSRCPDNHWVLQGASTNPPRCVLKQPP